MRAGAVRCESELETEMEEVEEAEARLTHPIPLHHRIHVDFL